MAGWVRLRGTPQVRPCRLGRAIHGAHAPATGPTPPSTDLHNLSGWHDLLLVGVDLGRHVDPRHAWMKSNPFDDLEIGRNVHPRMAWIYYARELSGVGRYGQAGPLAPWARGMPSGGLGRTPNPGLAVCAGRRTRARRHRAPWMGLRRVLPAHTAPPTSVAAFAVAVAVEVAGQRPALQRVPGGSPANTPATLVYTSVVHSAAIMPPGATRSGRGRKQEQDVAWAAGRCVWKQGRCLSCCWCGWRCHGWAMRAASTLAAITFWSAPRQPNLRPIARARRRCWPGRASRHG